MEFRDYLRILSARRTVILTAVVVTAFTALLVSLVLPAEYEANAEVLVIERDAGAAIFGQLLPELSSQPERSLQTQVRLITRPARLEQVIRDLDLRMSPDALAAMVAVSASGQTNVVTIQATDGDAVRAAAIANAMATEYVSWSRTQRQGSLRNAITSVEQRLAVLEREAVALANDASGDDEEAKVKLGIMTSSYALLSEKLEQLRINEELESGSAEVITPAVVGRSPARPAPVRNTVLGVMVGLVLGLGLAFLWDYLDDTVRDTAEVDRFFDRPKLAVIPFAAAGDHSARLAVMDDPGSPRAESYRVLRNALDFVNFDKQIKTLVVTSTAPSEGKSTVSANLAVALAQAGQRVIYIMSDFRRPTSHSMFGLRNVLGLSEVLTGVVTPIAGLVKPYKDLPLSVLVAGKMPPNPAELLASDRMKAIIDELAKHADWIIVDTPPVLAVSDGATVSRWADGVLLVVRLGLTTRAALARTGEIMSQVGANVVGVVTSVTEGSAEAGTAYGYGMSGAKGYETASAGSYYWSKRSDRHEAKYALLRNPVVLSAGFAVTLAATLGLFWVLDMAFGWGLIGQFAASIG